MMFGVPSQLQQLYTLEPCVASIRVFEALTVMVSLLVPFRTITFGHRTYTFT
ncbi:hypothetical protein LINPERHAP1_LOCUS27643 [Linum perenne]